MRRIQQLDQQVRLLRIAVHQPYHIRQARGDQPRRNFQHLAMATVIPDAAGQGLGREHAADQDQHQSPEQRTRQQPHAPNTTSSAVSM